MAVFRFRAAAALELRRREERAASGVLSRAEARFHELQAETDRLAARRAEAHAGHDACLRGGTDSGRLLWHRTWIDQLTASAGRLARQVDKQTGVVAEGRRAWFEARRKRRALERLQERALRRFREAEALDERKAIDELARLRFVMAEHWRDDP
jgi:flagellar export protein FliJ